jgi:diguanylate cyclase (GGDEF)-like protein
MLIFILTAWHESYFLIDKYTSFDFFITKGFLKYDFIYTPFLLPIVWWLGKQYDRAKYLSEKDDLTGAYNRRYLIDNFKKLAINSFIIYIVDVNDFKTINDTYGHHIGDEVLQYISSMLRQYVNKKDIIVRTGGDEFLVISKSECLLSQKLIFDIDDNIRVSVSIGTAMYPNDATTLNELVKIADKNMYKAKPQMKVEKYELAT